MHSFKKSIVCLLLLAFIPSSKAVAGDLSYGIKIGGANSFTKFNDKLKDALYIEALQQLELQSQQPKEVLKQIGLNLAVNSRMWNPWFGAALYMEYAFNHHIGLGAELLYNRFNAIINGAYDVADNTKLPAEQLEGQPKSASFTIILTTHTIGLPILLTWYWTGAIRPDFKENYFLGRLFAGLHSFYCISRSQKVECIAYGKEVKEYSTDGFKDVPFDKSEKRLKFGFIGGISLEFPSGLLIELKGMIPYNLFNVPNKDDRSLVASIHFSLGLNLAKLY
ncbi:MULTISPECIES: outer membrane beta-barrel protein [unclassified Candidatus Cardinium]|uniref:outer membrane beta-barrel protein n=1 Tax=unclassified Candidatus Cardinium TaxID=2641185 RepID=UPI001FB305F8|nr:MULTISPECIES: outer membrane beta-barrel protein [unclassified Candidatus Cardinium]